MPNVEDVISGGMEEGLNIEQGAGSTNKKIKRHNMKYWDAT